MKNTITDIIDKNMFYKLFRVIANSQFRYRSLDSSVVGWSIYVALVALLAQCVNYDYLIEAEWRIYAPVNKPSLVQIMACRLVAKPLSEPMLE